MFLYRVILGLYSVGMFLAQKKAVWAQSTDLNPIPTTEEVLPSDTLQNNFGSVSNMIGTAFNIVIAAAGAIFIILMLVGGTQYLTASGNEESLGKAKATMIQSIVGLIIVMSVWAIGTWVLGVVGYTGDDGSGIDLNNWNE